MNVRKRTASLFLALALSVGLAVPAMALDQNIKYDGDGKSDFKSNYTIKGATKMVTDTVAVKDLSGKLTYCFEGDFNTTVDVSGMEQYAVTLLEKQTDGIYLATKSGAEIMDRIETHVETPPRETVVDNFLKSDAGKAAYQLHKDKYPTVAAYRTYLLSVSKEDWNTVSMDEGIRPFEEFVSGSYYKFTKPGVYLLSASEGVSPLEQPAEKYRAVLFINDPTAPSTEPTAPIVSVFTDVASTSPYAEAVQWAVEKKITAGTTATTFAPGATCTNAQILTSLWRAKGQPEPTIANPFTDVSESNYYYKAALWAHEKGLVSGTEFGAATACTRGQTVTYLWTLAGKPAAKAATFTDVASDAAYAQAVAWAVEKGITTGTTATTFAPDNTCTRGQIVTFLYRDMK